MQTAFNTEKISKPLASHHHDSGMIIALIYWLILVQKKRSNQLNDWILKKAAFKRKRLEAYGFSPPRYSCNNSSNILVDFSAKKKIQSTK